MTRLLVVWCVVAGCTTAVTHDGRRMTAWFNGAAIDCAPGTQRLSATEGPPPAPAPLNCPAGCTCIQGATDAGWTAVGVMSAIIGIVALFH